MPIIPFYSTSKSHYQFSNFYQSEIIINGTKYQSNENYYQAIKAKHFGAEKEVIEKIVATTPRNAKSMAHKIECEATLAQIEAWNNQKINVMRTGLNNKFTQNSRLSKLLLSTNNSTLVEASKSDTFWGAGTNEVAILKDGHWYGLNVMGKLLMELRNDR